MAPRPKTPAQANNNKNIDIDINAYITITKTINDANIIDICRPRNKVNKNITITTGNRDYYSSVNINLRDNILQSFESKDKIYMKINAYLFEYLCKYRPVFEDNKLLNIFKLKYSEVTENNYLLVQDNILNINLFNKKLDTYIITKETRKLENYIITKEKSCKLDTNIITKEESRKLN